MKLFLFVVISAFLAVSVTSVSEVVQTLKDKRNKAIEDCKTEKPDATKEDFAILSSFEVPKNELQSCLIDCLYTKLGVFVDGKLSEESFKNSTKAVAGDDKEKLARMNELFQKCSKEIASTNEKCIGKAMRTCVTTYFPDVVNWYKSVKKST